MKTEEVKAMSGVRAARITEMKAHRQVWLASGLSRAAYAGEHGLSAATFTRWMARRAEESKGAVKSSRRGRATPRTRKGQGDASRLLPVRIVIPDRQDSRGPQGVDVEFASGLRLHVPAGYPLEYLSGLVALLEPKAC